MRELKIYKIVLFFLIIIAITLLMLVIKKIYNHNRIEKNAQDVVTRIKEDFIKSQIESKEKVISAEIEGYKIIGIINIPKINLEYPILEKTDDISLNLAITKFSGNQINEIGNVSLAGHNNLDGMMFGKIEKLKNGDIIQLTDGQNITLNYEIFKTYVVEPNEISCILPVKEDTREVTLITCTNGRNNRYIVKAMEIEKI